MGHLKLTTASVALALGLGACAQTPTGPHVQVLPAQGKPFEVFAQEQATCKQYAADQVSGQAENANERAVATTLIGGSLRPNGRASTLAAQGPALKGEAAVAEAVLVGRLSNSGRRSVASTGWESGVQASRRGFRRCIDRVEDLKRQRSLSVSSR